ncbi:MAG: acetaldehyde dehydrogenase [Acidobacteria bacterium]|nr:MAG: acetaldehyde dehydrogenase [Acidobacteriota bacterium]
MLHDKDLVSVQEARTKVEKAYAAFQKFRSFTQEQVDAIVERMAAAGRAQARRLAELAVEETGYGNAKDKLAKNLLCADFLPRRMRGLKTVGIIRELPDERVVEIGVPVGVVAAILPTTNPTSTAIFKILISLKAGNAIVLSPHPNARRCTCETTEVLYRAALEAGAPEDIIGCVTSPTLEATHALMRHERTGVILSTGGHGIVKAAYSSGKPAFGVGPGNVPVLIERSADIPDAVQKVIEGKSFDFGTVCSSEQAIVAEETQRERIVAELKARRAFFCNAQQKDALAKLLLTPNGTVNPKCVGQPAPKIAQMAGFEVPPDTPVLVVELNGVGKEHPLSAEKLSPVLALYFVKDFSAGVEICRSLLRFGGLGHTCVIHCRDDAKIRHYALEMPAFRVLVNTSAPQGSTGITTNVFPSMTLGCGAIAGNITSDNIGPLNLINVKRLAYAVRKPEEALAIPNVQTPTTVSSPSSAASASPELATSQSLDRGTLVSAVERYLNARGFVFGATPQEPLPTVPMTAPVAQPGLAAGVVDRFLSSRRAPGSQVQAPSPEPAQCPPASTNPEPPAANIALVDFVCEADVRAAIDAGRKIYIGPKAIITPSARELADRFDILVLAQR